MKNPVIKVNSLRQAWNKIGENPNKFDLTKKLTLSFPYKKGRRQLVKGILSAKWTLWKTDHTFTGILEFTPNIGASLVESL